MKHFNNNVPEETQNNLRAFAEYAEDRLQEVFGGEQYGCSSIDEVSGVGRSGFFPCQDGGFKVSDFTRNDTDPSYHITEGQTASIERQSADCYASFLAENELPEETELSELSEEMKGEYYQYENEWLQPATVEIRAYIKGGVVFLETAINYEDTINAGAEQIKAVELSEQAFNRLQPEQILEKLLR